MPARDERTSLLRETSPPSTSSKPVQTWREVYDLMRSMAPISISFALQNVVQAWNILLAGTLGSFELEVASYGFMFASCTGAMVAFGGATALDTLCGQAMTSVMNSDTDRKRLGLYLQQTLLVLLGLFFIFIAPLWVFSGQLFQVLGLQRELSATTGTFLQSLLASGLLQVVSECLKKFLQVQGESGAVGWVTAVAACLGALVSYVTVNLSNLGLWGCAVAFTIYQFLNVVGFVSLMIHRPFIRESMRFSAFGLSKGLFAVTTFAITGTLTVAVEWWSFEILALFAGRLDAASIGAQSILMTSDIILTTVGLGLGVAASHRIGYHLGAGGGRLARHAAGIPYIVSALIASVEAAVLLPARHTLGYIFTQDTDIVEITARLVPIVALYQFLDISNGGASGVLRGAGKNHLAGLSNCVGFYAVGLPCAYWLCFSLKLGLFGLWLGVATGSLALLALQTGCIIMLRWDQMADQVAHSYAW